MDKIEHVNYLKNGVVELDETFIQYKNDKAGIIEMSQYDHAFLLWFIDEFKPSKILEVGIAAGGTDALILMYLEKIGLQSVFYSADLNNNVYYDRYKKTGYLADEVYEDLNLAEKGIIYRQYLGHTVADCIEEIGEGIELLIIDTVHSLPGEILDFIACLPFLSDNAIVILHDIRLNHFGINRRAFATKVLFDVVKAEKFYTCDDVDDGRETNIAAFRITDESKKYILDVFSSLTLTWEYIPDDIIWEEYRKIVEKYYDSVCLKHFDSGLALNIVSRNMHENAVKEHRNGDIEILESKLKAEKNILIYGCGFLGKRYYHYAIENGYNIQGMVYSDDYNISAREMAGYNIPVYRLSEVPFEPEQAFFVIAVGEKIHATIEKNLKDAGFCNYM